MRALQKPGIIIVPVSSWTWSSLVVGQIRCLFPRENPDIGILNSVSKLKITFVVSRYDNTAKVPETGANKKSDTQTGTSCWVSLFLT